ncbi:MULTISPECIES: LPS assembly lipoprotein LptE [unclassified Moritella]|uniref:LPS-assembly lipoprotein LptE n=1 Tax=unclassified Moritella TaxID=2637987 RepID=UPI001BAD639C|nr:MULTISPECIES: LPS assembly lipoprotein LptE [unclassified Moritella]QUM86538.1 RlpB protein [Moritella sp. 28]QUM90764.1 RlpB protein [Moritella sp. 36]
MIASALKPGFIRLICIFLFTAILGGCGFHLKNGSGIPNELRNLTLVSSKYSDLTRLIKQDLRYNQINLVVPTVASTTSNKTLTTESDNFSDITDEDSTKTKTTAMDPALLNSQTPILRIMSESTERRTVSLYSDASAAEYELSYVIKMEVRLPNQEPQYFTVALQRDLLNNPQRALASSRESELLEREMREAAAQQIVRTLSQVIIKPQTIGDNDDETELSEVELNTELNTELEAN